MIKKLLCVVLSGSMIFGNAGITMASETEPETVQENVNEETDSPEESFSEEDIFEDGISADDEAAAPFPWRAGSFRQLLKSRLVFL